MTTLHIPWSPRILLSGRTFRLPVQAADQNLEIEAEGFREITRRWSDRDQALFYYLQAPDNSGDYPISITHQDQTTRAQIQVRTLDDLRQPFKFNEVWWPRRWPLGQPWQSAKTRQTLQDWPVRPTDAATLQWWLSRDDATLWNQLPPSELPRAHFVNVHQGCPQCGTAIFTYGGFYPWKRSHRPCDFRSSCPSCGAVFPSNDLADDDFTTGDGVDDGYGYFDENGHIFLFAATYHRDQVRSFGAAIGLLTDHLRTDGFDAEVARRLGIMLLRYAVEEIYLAAVPQFRYGPTEGEEKPWPWGQPDWGAEPDPVAALYRKGSLRYCIDTPYISETLALAYDTIWPFLREDEELLDRIRALGPEVQKPNDLVALVEEMLTSLLQCALDGGASSNLPRVSEGVLVLLRSLDRPDARDVVEWLYDRGPDKLRVFGSNNFFPDGTPPESTGGYNSIHTNGLFSLEYHLRRLRQDHPEAYPETDFPSLVADPRAARVVRAPCEITLIGRSWFQFGDGSAPGSSAQLGRADSTGEGSIRLQQEIYHAPMNPRTLEWGEEFTDDPVVTEIRGAVSKGEHRRLGSTVHDGVGIAILRTGEKPERAAAGICYGDTTGHRHMDLLDVQLFAFERPFLTDLGYPQSWASIHRWEAQWATHNSVWSIVPDLDSGRIAGRGRLLHCLAADGVQILDIEAERWAWDGDERRWYRPGVTFRRLLALIETDGQGVVLVDLARIRGGSEHWRVCRGLEGEFDTGEMRQKKPGTVAGENIERGRIDALPHPDYAALAHMDDVAALYAGPFWKGTWQSRRESSAHLDLRQLRASPGTQIITARATAVMGRPEESNYCYRTALWKRKPCGENDTTCVDLVFEPRLDRPTLARACTVPSSDPTASGVELRTCQGRQIEIYWAPHASYGDRTSFENRTELQGSLALIVDGRETTQGVGLLKEHQKSFSQDCAVQHGRIVALDRQARSIDVEGLQSIATGARIRVNPEKRGHSYLVEEVEDLGAEQFRLRLDVTSLLGRARVSAVSDHRLELDFQILARTGNLHGTRLQIESGGQWQKIDAAFNPDAGSTVVELEEPLAVEIGEWASVVDYVKGDEVLFEPVCSAG